MSEQKTFYRTYKANTGYDGFNIGHKLNNTDDALYLGDKKLAFDSDKTVITSGGTNLSSVDVSELKGSDLEYYGENGSFLSGAIKTKGAISEETDSYIRAVGLMDNTANDSGVEYIDKSDYTMHIFGTNKRGPAMRTTNIQGTIEQSVNVDSARIAVLSSTSAFTFNNKQVATKADLDDYAELADIPENYDSDHVIMTSGVTISGVTVYEKRDSLTKALNNLTNEVVKIEKVVSESVSELYEDVVTGATINGKGADVLANVLVLSATTVISGDTILDNFYTSDIIDNVTTIYSSGTPITTANLSEFISDPIYEQPVTYSELYEMYQSGSLNPGGQYLITDYSATSSKTPLTSVNGEVFGIIVTADDEYTLNAKARARKLIISHFVCTDENGKKFILTKDEDSDVTYTYSFTGTNKTESMELLGYRDANNVLYYSTGEYDNSTFYLSGVTATTSFKQKVTKMGAVRNTDSLETWLKTNKIISEPNKFYEGTGSDYFSDSDLTKWEVWYDIENNTNKYDWADANGKGVIYRLIDEFGNDCYYDFKSIMFRRFENTELGIMSEISSGSTSAYCYTFSDSDYNDSSLNGFENNVYDNKIGYRKLIGKYYLNNTIFLGNNCYGNILGVNNFRNTFGYGSYYNTIGNEYVKNTAAPHFTKNKIGNEVQNNTFYANNESNIIGNLCIENIFNENCDTNILGDYCQNNTFDKNCGSNKFGNYCCRNIIGKTCKYNEFGTWSTDNTLGDFCSANRLSLVCSGNTFGNYCTSNIMENECKINNIGNSANTNTFLSNCEHIEIGNFCIGNNFGSSVKYVMFGNKGTLATTISGYYRYIKIESGNCYIVLKPYSTSALSKTNFIQNILINKGVNSSTSWKVISLEENDYNAEHLIEYKANNSEERII